MAFRVAIVTDSLHQHAGSISNVLQEHSSAIAVQIIEPRNAASRLSPFELSPVKPVRRGTLHSLLTYKPHLVVCNDFGHRLLEAAIYRKLSRSSRLLLLATEAPAKLGVFGRLTLGAADAVVAEGEAAVHAVEQLRFPSSRIFATAAATELDAFFACRRSRPEITAGRIAFAGDLSPQSGAADLMIAVASWAEGNPNRKVDIWWIGEGDLAGVLDAQPLPPGVTQRFLGRLEPPALAAAFAQCTMLAVPSLVDERRVHVVEALAAGLPVLGSRLDRKVRRWVRDDVNGWLFNPMRPEEMAAALDRALDSSPWALEQMSARAQASVRPSAKNGLTERLARAFAVVMPEFAPAGLASAGLTSIGLAHPTP